MGSFVSSTPSDTYVLKYEDTITHSNELNQPAKYPRKASKVHPSAQAQLVKTQSQLMPGGRSNQIPLQARPSMPNLLVPIKHDKAVRCSEKYSWLMKDGHFGNATLNDFEFGRVIGKGLMGTVRVCKTKAGKYFVLKSVKKDYINKHNDLRHVKNEKTILTTLHSPFCIKLFGTFQDRVYLHFALEYAPGGELFHRLGRKKSFAPAVAKFYATEVFSALEHVQKMGFVYRDLKPENVILDEDGHCKLVDFGFSRPAPTDDDRIHTLCGTPAYLSPEQLDGKLTNGYTRVVDWWSYGILVYELLTGKTPFSRSNHESHYEIFLRILKSKIWFPMGFDARSKELICSLCHANIDKRLCSAPEIKVHPYFEMPWDMVEQRKLVPPFVPKLKEDGDCHYFTQFNDSGLPPNYKSDDMDQQLFFDF